MKKQKYADLYTLRKDGRYQGYYRDAAGKRHVVCDRDPEQLHRKLQEKEAAARKPAPEITFRQVAESWEAKHREEIEVEHRGRFCVLTKRAQYGILNQGD